jgi:hypothetical protein
VVRRRESEKGSRVAGVEQDSLPEHLFGYV